MCNKISLFLCCFDEFYSSVFSLSLHPDGIIFHTKNLLNCRRLCCCCCLFYNCYCCCSAVCRSLRVNVFRLSGCSGREIEKKNSVEENKDQFKLHDLAICRPHICVHTYGAAHFFDCEYPLDISHISRLTASKLNEMNCARQFNSLIWRQITENNRKGEK